MKSHPGTAEGRTPRQTSPRRTLLGACSALAALLLTRRAKAAIIPVIPVYDPARFVAMIEQLRQVAVIYGQLSAGADLLENAARRLPTSVRSADDILLGVRSLRGDVNSIGYRIDTVTRQYNALFPDERAIHDTEPAELNELSGRWDQEIHLSSLAAARSQTTLSSIDSNTRSARDVLGQSSSQTSGVAQLQALVKMIEIVNSDLASLATTLNATERVNASLAATEASTREVTAERSRRLLDGYDPQPAPVGIDRDFLPSTP